jgi:hypothetical protein
MNTEALALLQDQKQATKDKRPLYEILCGGCMKEASNTKLRIGSKVEKLLGAGSQLIKR